MTEAPDSPSIDGLNALVVEDEALIAFLLEDMLAELGCTNVRHAPNLHRALVMIDEQMPDFALLDVNLGGVFVYPAAERLAAAGVPFIFTTGYGHAGIAPAWAARPVLQKPFGLPVLRSAIGKVLAETR